MARWREAEFQTDLRRLLRAARRGRGQLPLQTVGSHEIRHDLDFEYKSIPGAQYMLDAEALALRRALRRRLAGTSRRDLGISGDEAGILLEKACDEAVLGTIKETVDNLIAAVEAPVEDWVVAQPVKVDLPQRRVRVGHVTYTRRIPPSVARRAVLERLGERVKPPVAYVTVQARGWQTARILAAERLADAASIVDLIQRPKLNRVGGPLLIRAKGKGEHYADDSFQYIHPNVLDAGRLRPPFRQLALAAAREEDARSDWERRCLAATRWLSRSLNGTSPADRLVALMVALESMFIAGRHEPGKGALIGERVSERFTVPERTADQLRSWLEDLYRGRNDAAHEGRDFLDDLDVDRLSELTHYVVRAMSWHLVAGHRYARHSCRTHREAMACSGRP